MVEKYFYISKQKADELLEQIAGKQHDKRGASSRCFLCGDYAVLSTKYINISSSDSKNVDYDKLIKTIKKLHNKGVNVVPVLGYCYEERTFEEGEYKSPNRVGFIFQQRAKGKELWQSLSLPIYQVEVKQEHLNYIFNRMQTLINAPQEHFDKFIKDFIAINKAGILIDTSRSENFFYDEQAGFSFIDLDRFGYEKKVDINLVIVCAQSFLTLNKIDQYKNCVKNGKITQETFNKIMQLNNVLMQKVICALINNGITEQEIYKAIWHDKDYDIKSLILKVNPNAELSAITTE